MKILFILILLSLSQSILAGGSIEIRYPDNTTWTSYNCELVYHQQSQVFNSGFTINGFNELAFTCDNTPTKWIHNNSPSLVIINEIASYCPIWFYSFIEGDFALVLECQNTDLIFDDNFE